MSTSADIFLSYSRDDATTARRFAQALEAEGLTVWWDAALQTGESFDEAIEKALNEAKAVVVLWSKKSVDSRWVRAEATEAARNHTLVPVIIEPCKRPIIFELTHTADLSHWNGDTNDPAWRTFISDVHRLAEKGGLPKVASTSRSHTSATPVLEFRSRRTAIVIASLIVMIAAALLYVLLHSTGPNASSVASNPAMSTAPATATAQTPPTTVSLAVLPFVDLSPQHDQDYFSDGLSEELLNQLAKIKDLQVSGRTSSFFFKGKNEDLRVIGQKLGVNHLLEGSVRKEGKQLRINAQLINVGTGAQLWSQTYDRKLENVFAVQEEIAKAVAAELRVQLDPAQQWSSGTTNLAAFDELLNGRGLLNSTEGTSMVAAVPHLERAVTLDPSYLEAWLWLIDAYLRTSLADPKQAAGAIHSQDLAIDKVVALVPGSPQANFALSYRAGRTRNLAEQEQLLRASLALSGGLGVRVRMRFGQFLLTVGQIGAAIRELEGVRRDEPLDIFACQNLLVAYDVGQDYARSNAEYERLLGLPGGQSALLRDTALSRALDQHDSRRLRETLNSMAAHSSTAELVGHDMRSWPDDPALARRELHHKVETSADMFESTSAAQLAAYFDDRDLALQALRKAGQQASTFETWGWIMWRPVFHDLRGTPAFKTFLRDFGFRDYWRTSGSWGDFCHAVGKDDFECR